METTYDRILNWYKKQPWWGKVLFFGVLAVPFLIGIAQGIVLLIPKKKLTPLTKPSNSPPFGKVNEALDTRIETLKKELLVKLETVRQTGIRASERRDAIKTASTMAELDALKKKYGL
jgi:hypothetical protein